MRTVVVGLGIQGAKRLAVAGSDAVATVDPVSPKAQFKDIKDVPLEKYDSALLCVPDPVKPELLDYLLSNKKHFLF
jgi:scyllo-inositol 2-dehydrogenase (NADP+)